MATEIEGKNKRKGKGKRGKLCLTKGKIRNRCVEPMVLIVKSINKLLLCLKNV